MQSVSKQKTYQLHDLTQYGKYILGQAIGSIHLPSCTIRPSGQKHPSAHPLGQLEISGLSQVLTHSEPHCWYVIPGGHSVIVNM